MLFYAAALQTLNYDWDTLRSITARERTDGPWGLAPELMCRVQREKTGIRGSAGVYCGRARAKMEILVTSAGEHGRNAPLMPLAVA